MILYILLIIPILNAFILFYFFRKKIDLIEYSILFFGSLIFILFAKFIFEKANITDTEIWGEYATRINYYEPWDEYIHRICIKQVPSGTDSNGNTTYTTVTYDCSYVQYHPEKYTMITNIGNEIEITKEKYLYYKKKWNNSFFKELNRPYHNIDGDVYYSNWNNDFNYMITYFTEHYFENRVKGSNSIFNETNLDTVNYKGLIKYPELKNNQIGAYQVNSQKLISEDLLKANDELIKYNAFYGSKYKIRMSVLIFLNKTQDYYEQQRLFWLNGKKNELIVVIGVNDSLDINWVNIMTWSDSELLKSQLKAKIYDMKRLCYECLNSFIIEEMKINWKRKDFSDFDYLTIEPTAGQFIGSFIFVFLFNIGFGIFFVKNDYDSKIF